MFLFIVLCVPPSYWVPLTVPSAHLHVCPVFVICGNVNVLDCHFAVNVAFLFPNVYTPFLSVPPPLNCHFLNAFGIDVGLGVYVAPCPFPSYVIVYVPVGSGTDVVDPERCAKLASLVLPFHVPPFGFTVNL